jgi:hypothetical protein
MQAVPDDPVYLLHVFGDKGLQGFEGHFRQLLVEKAAILTEWVLSPPRRQLNKEFDLSAAFD